ncbi:membrane protein [Youngiibacter fragilis]|uniref:Membrane protein n=1 Tax=Youngiibacter fragilis 232.1 TaxID=994573 RepID=V7I163_9CLOT|nr:membrane protein [Youngiibacter fragilis]ETA78939.1 membrane protein [Youngiibacter fragilis 232.1]
MDILRKIEKFVSHFAVRGLMKYIVILTGTVFFLDLPMSGRLTQMLYLDRDLVLSGQIWRLLTFVIVPAGSGFFTIITLIFYYWIGNVLEMVWGTNRFNTYYFLGVAFTVIAGMILGFTTIYYVNLSLFLAYAAFFPENTVYVMFVLPVKMKYLAAFQMLYLLYEIVAVPNIALKVAIVLSILNFLIFFGPEYLRKSRRSVRTSKMRKDLDSYSRQKTASMHKCTICGITEKDDPDMDFRYCSKCEGHFEYCEKHILEHEHRSNVINLSEKKKKIN